MRLLHNLKRLRMLSRILSFGQLAKLSIQYGVGTPLNSLSVAKLKHPVWWRGRNSDVKVLFQIFEFGECDIDLARKPDLIIDGGANVGYSAVFFANKYPGVPIIAVEPDGENLKILKLNCDPYPQIRSIQGAIWKTHSHLKITNPEAASWAFVVEEISQPSQGSFEGYSVDELVGSAKNVLLKLDIEGAEKVVFAHKTPWIENVGALVIEVHGTEAESIVKTAMAPFRYVLTRQGEKLMFNRPA